MGLFDETLARYHGTFYRQFSQYAERPDLAFYFGDEAVAVRGICAGSCMDWLEHYLTAPRGVRYSNELMSRHRQKIVTIQRALRFRDQSLVELCTLYGLQTRTGHLVDHEVTVDNVDDVVALIAVSVGVDVISYTDPQQGKHVVVCYVRAPDRMMYFVDVHRGDVEVPYPHSAAWLTRYFGLFLERCGSMRVTHFRPVWNLLQANQAYRAVVRDSLRFNPRTLGIDPQHRARDDAHHVVGFRQRGRLGGLV
jgi:hypothetical protein